MLVLRKNTRRKVPLPAGAIGFSLSLHACLLMLLFRFKGSETRPAIEQQVTVDIVEGESRNVGAGADPKVSRHPPSPRIPQLNWLRGDMGDTAPSEIGADPAQGQSASQEDLLSARTQVTPWMETIAQRIDEAITYPRDVFGEPPLFELDLTFFVRPDGSLSHFDNVGPENRKTAWLVRSITRALANFPLEKKIQRPLGLTRMRARFVLEFPEFRARGPAKLRSWIGSRMIFKESRKKSLSLIHPMAMRLAHSDMFALGVGTDLIALYKYLFPDRLPSTDYKRLQDDIFFRLREMEFSCDTGRAEGACLEAGRIHRMLGQRSEASIWLRKACQMSLQEACDELRILRNGV